MSDLMIVVYCWTNVFNLNIYENLLINKLKKKNNDDSISQVYLVKWICVFLLIANLTSNMLCSWWKNYRIVLKKFNTKKFKKMSYQR